MLQHICIEQELARPITERKDAAVIPTNYDRQ